MSGEAVCYAGTFGVILKNELAMPCHIIAHFVSPKSALEQGT
jgi:hypothetical protein